MPVLLSSFLCKATRQGIHLQPHELRPEAAAQGQERNTQRQVTVPTNFYQTALDLPEPSTILLSSKTERKTLILTVLWLLFDFYL
jgi:hypothetical protein